MSQKTHKEFLSDLNEFLITDETNRVTLDTPMDEIEVLFKTIYERLPDDVLDFENPKEDYFNEHNNYPTKIGGHHGC